MLDRPLHHLPANNQSQRSTPSPATTRRVTTYQTGTTPLADSALVNDIGLAETAEEASERVKLALDKKAQELRDYVEASAQREREAVRQKQEAEKRAAAAAADADSAARARAETERVLREEQDAHKETERTLQERLKSEDKAWDVRLDEAATATEQERKQRQDVERRVDELEKKENERVKRVNACCRRR